MKNGLDYPLAIRIMRRMPVRKTHIEIIRILAIVLVVANHTPAYSMPFSTGDISLGTYSMMCVAAFIKTAVPLFFMISGALLIPKKETISELLHKRVLRFLLVIPLFALFQVIYHYCAETPDSPHDVTSQIIQSLYYCRPSATVPTPAMWFLYAYVCLLLVMPFLRLLADRLTKNHIIYLICLPCVLSYIIPLTFAVLMGRTPGVNGLLQYSRFLTSASAYMVYAIIGYYLENVVDVSRISWKKVCILLAVGCCSIALEAFSEVIVMMRAHLPTFDPELVTFRGLMVIPTAVLYLFVKKLCWGRDPSSRSAKVLGYIGAATFTAFLLESIFSRVFSPWFANLQTDYFSSWVLALLVTACGILVGLVLKRIPLLNKLL